MKSCLIITGGTLDLDFAGSFLKKMSFDAVIAVDAGLEHVKALGLTPTKVVGDFDTVRPDILEEFQAVKGITWDIHKPEKDETDTELAIWLAMEIGCSDLTILGATGGRFDHALGNVHLLKQCLDRGIFASIIDRKNKIYLLKEGKTFQKDRVFGRYISFLPLTERVTGITLTGFKYPLSGKTIEIGTSLCISNEMTEEESRITFQQGILICVESHD